MIGRTISHYQIEEKLGGGGMGVVYKAEDTRLKRTVALKFLPPDLTRDDDARERFVQEAQAASALDHVNICTIHEIDETDDGQTFIAMAYYPGETLKKKIERGPLPVEQAVERAIQVAQGLERAHEEGIIHRDIKPANVMVTDRGVVKVVDFGLAKVAEGVALTQTGRSVGTPAYMSPEQARGEAVDARTDVWSLGVVLYEMLTGERPFRGDYEQAVIYSILNQDLEPVTALRPEVSEELAAVVHRALEKEPEARYGTMAEMLEALKAYQASLQPAGAAALGVKTLLRQARVVIPALVVLLVLGALGVWWISHSAKVRWARQEAIPEIARLVEEIPWNGEGLESWRAFELAAEAAQFIPNDSILIGLWPRFSRYVDIHSEPPGASVYAKPYANPDREWRYLGQTPLDSIRFPRGYSRLMLEKDGFRQVHDIYWNPFFVSNDRGYVLPEAGSIPEDMELVPDSTSPKISEMLSLVPQ